eukprot:6207260-Pleurochrysis_carterae.AAC.1
MPSTACHASTSLTRSLPLPSPASCPGCVRQFYGQAGELYVCSQPLAADVVRVCSMQGARQGGPMGIFLFCLGFLACFMETQQHEHPDVMIAAFADDDYALGLTPRYC